MLTLARRPDRERDAPQSEISGYRRRSRQVGRLHVADAGQVEHLELHTHAQLPIIEFVLVSVRVSVVTTVSTTSTPLFPDLSKTTAVTANAESVTTSIKVEAAATSGRRVLCVALNTKTGHGVEPATL